MNHSQQPSMQGQGCHNNSVKYTKVNSWSEEPVTSRASRNNYGQLLQVKSLSSTRNSYSVVALLLLTCLGQHNKSKTLYPQVKDWTPRAGDLSCNITKCEHKVN
eukprot:4239220-Amphidinium_carterae.1